MNEEMLKELWKNGEETLRRWKDEGRVVADPKDVVMAVLRDLKLPKHIEWGDVMPFPAAMVERGDERQSMVAMTYRTEGFDHATLLAGLRKIFGQYTKPTTIFIYMPPLPMFDSSRTMGWAMRYTVRPGFGWKLVEHQV